MFFDQVTLLLAIGVSSGALCVTLFGAWIGSRRDTFLFDWSAGLGSIVLGVVLISVIGRNYDPVLQAASFTTLLIGFGFIYAGSMQFRLGTTHWVKVWAVTGLGALSTIGAFALGFSGIGTIIANLGIAFLLVLTGWQYWGGRSEAPIAMAASAILYAISAVSFALCGLVIALERQWILTALPTNWAESINSIVVIIGLTGIGALSLSVNQARISRFHRMEALTDPLTKLLNRRALMDRYTAAARPRTAVVLFDLDHFKSINDSYGHAMGDLVLCHFAEILSTRIRISDVAARVGGEEFCVILHNVDRQIAMKFAEHIRAKIEEKAVTTTKGPISVTVSVGVAYSSDRGESFNALLERADQALYKAKTGGRNRVKSATVRLVG
ncbi:GGDEF domain-containing protein [Mesorhizobium sp. CGMCC 1.15528]|uniref:diguanylate cyclase n=1 Tax=Mesorhizobium zhangyense TaxID=1776730 RepID=A0A7C9RE71_9HYPH|nr:GGDEF domain-containing protein [Mesorhizobium zhangyense]NGN44493.1 GGDEF domain-containing protein [Mesorhizobium zhangyense]